MAIKTEYIGSRHAASFAHGFKLKENVERSICNDSDAKTNAMIDAEGRLLHNPGATETITRFETIAEPFIAPTSLPDFLDTLRVTMKQPEIGRLPFTIR